MARKLPHDWIDVGLHLLVATVAVGLLVALGQARGEPWIIWAALAANTLGWPLREALQRRAKERWDWSRPWLWSAQKQWEAWPPVVAGWTVALALKFIAWGENYVPF